jgi:transposase
MAAHRSRQRVPALLGDQGCPRSQARVVRHELAEATRVAFQQHRDSAIFTSFPGLGELPSARLLAEIGDDRTRFADARGLKAYAGAAPVTRASGKKLVVLHRTVKNNRLAATGYLWTFAAIRLSVGARAHYNRRRLAGDRHAAAQCNLFNRFLGCLYYCLQTGQNLLRDTRVSNC